MSSSSLEPSDVATGGGGQEPSPLVDFAPQEPIRAELLGLERLGEQARVLARACSLAPRRRASSPLLARFTENRRVLIKARRAIIGGGGQQILGIDADWLADNFHIIDDVLREVRLDLPRGYDAVLPKLSSPPLAGYPRVYALALALVAHTDSELDEVRIDRFILAFQEVAPLTIGELWALPTMCRVVLIENLRRLAEQMLWGWNERLRAEQWWKGILEQGEAHSRSSEQRSSTERIPPLGELSDPYVVRLQQLLRDEGGQALAAMSQLESELGRGGKDPEEILAREGHRQAANQVTIGNCVISLRLLSTVDWNAFFERSSVVQQILREDPANAYPLQDFITSDRCRKVVEKIARGSKADEPDVARQAIALARAGMSRNRASGHVGYYLLGQGERALRDSFGYRPATGERFLEAILAHPKAVYFGSLCLLLLVFLLTVSRGAMGEAGSAAWYWMALILLVAILPASELVVGLVNHLLTLLLPPRVLPKLEFKEAIPDEFFSLVVMPSMLVRPGSAEVLCERLETHYLANPTPGVRFVLLTDFADAPRQEMPEDRSLIDDALHRVRDLNCRYAGAGPDLFYLFHRRRLWNPAQGCWMGWERKRGKLSEFNRLLRGDRNTTYTFCSAEPSSLPPTRFVITLDADTQMPRDTVSRLIGTLAHPLNRPRFDAHAGRVVEGYGVLQPRVSFHLTAATHSHFAALLAASGGIDPYSTAASDAYMDLFGLGSFTGKGIYDVEAFESATGSVFPENQILSHDLIEGNYSRCGLLSDTELFDDFPARYLAYARREHRWVRGDWQLLPWLGRRVPAPEGTRPNPLPALERWKLLDNLRRSLVPPGVIVMLTLGWTVLPGSPWLWSTIALAVLALPFLKWLIGAAVACLRTGSLAGFSSWRVSIPSMGGQAILSLVLLADQAGLSCDAIARTLWRLLVSRRKLLEWETAAAAEQRLGSGLKDFARGMWGASALALAIALAIAMLRPAALWAASPFLTAWLLAPFLAFWLSRPKPRKEFTLTEDERIALRRLARRTWGFFETFVGEIDHWLPPDNYQEDPDGRVAHRTSPTNQGLLLLSSLAAHDLGYISLDSLVDRLERTFDSLEKMEKHWGHFYNWYDTRTLQPLSPLYISTVDSGNFLACLVALKQGLREKLRQPALGSFVATGLNDTLQLIEEKHRAKVLPIEKLLQEQPASLPAWIDWLQRLEHAVERLILDFDPAIEDEEEEDRPARWAEALLRQVRDRGADLAALAPSLSINPSSLLHDRLIKLIQRAEALVAAMDFRPLYKSERHLYAIGADLNHGQLDGACYDLLASESCLTSYLTVARGDAPRRHWFQLGRPFIQVAGQTGLMSWGGTMFEYLMPRLLLRSLPGTLLAEACRTAVLRQMEYGRLLGIPWGISESAFNDRFLEGDYRYQSFGVPGLGLKRGLERDQVVAPYATVMATMIAPREALANLQRLAGEGAEGPFGFYEAVDYTPERRSPNGRPAVVRSYMAHHQGMSLVAMTNALCDDVMPKRFHAEPMVRAADLLLQERIPPDPPIAEPAPADLDRPQPGATPTGGLLSRRLTSPHTNAPRSHLLSNSRFHVMITNAGSGFSKCQRLDVTRWREDAACERWGQFFYIRDVKTGAVWSAGHQPVCRPADHYEVVFSTDKASFRRRDRDVETQMEITVSPEHLAEVRRITLTNLGNQPRELEVTSYLEPVLLNHAADLSHPAFFKLFLQTEHLAESDALLCRRRARSAGDPPVWGVHVMAVDRSAPGSSLEGNIQYETDRARFIGRGRSVADPAALDANTTLSGIVGAVLDPVLSLRGRFRISPGGSAAVGFTLAVVESRTAACAVADHFHGMSAVARAFELAWAHSQVKQGHQSESADDDHLFQRFGAHLLFAGSAHRSHPDLPGSDHPALILLQKLGLSGDLAILVARIAEPGELSLARQLLSAHDFLRVRGLESDLVLFREGRADENENLTEAILELVREAGFEELVGRRGGVHLIEHERITEEESAVLEAAARVVLDGSRGSLARQIDRIEWFRPLPDPAEWPDTPVHWDDEPVHLPDGLLFPNGLGGFTADSREYCILIGPHDLESRQLDGQPNQGTGWHSHLPPAPWVNVIANPGFGFLVSESGSGFTWAQNSQTNRLTTWSNDPVMDPPAEVVYLRDEQTGQVWSATPLPAPSHDPTLVRHGQGYTIFERNTHGIAHELSLLVPAEESIKLIRLRLRNLGSRQRSLSATFFAEWVLGTTRDHSAMHVVTELDSDTGALLARNSFREDFSQRVAFADVNRRPTMVTGDRVEFLGRHGSPSSPAALERVGLSGRTGAGLDPCAALQVRFLLDPHESTELVFILGEADDLESAHELIRNFWEPSQTVKAFADTTRRWDRLLQTASVRTPDPAFDLLMNRWLLYQVIGCRLWARSAFYQSGGALGFRDQLQDVLALVHAAPDLVREQVLRAAARQFVEGDVQHWWHPPAGRGVRTRIADDLLWLPYVTSYYVAATGDSSILDEVTPYLEAPPLEPGQDDAFGLPSRSTESGSLYEHCTRALERATRLGSHGLPLMGSGDWNDGMNRVGVKGRGESVWLAWFLADCLRGFARIASDREDVAKADLYRKQADALCTAVETHAWDGSWYLRAFFDDGTPLGSARSDVCQIDSIAQSWGVITAFAAPERGRQALQSVVERLVRNEDGLILLLSPPFDDGPVDPGYIKGYPSGIRENGAQYTHAATWVVQAIALLGQGDLAFRLFQSLNPILHTADQKRVHTYKVEPYALAGDVYSLPPHVGRGGWTWYTGAAGWLYRVGLENILGIHRFGDSIRLDPCFPRHWKSCEITYRFHSTTYTIAFENPLGLERGTAKVWLDGQLCGPSTIPLVDDRQAHQVRVLLGNV